MRDQRCVQDDSLRGDLTVEITRVSEPRSETRTRAERAFPFTKTSRSTQCSRVEQTVSRPRDSTAITCCVLVTVPESRRRTLDQSRGAVPRQSSVSWFITVTGVQPSTQCHDNLMALWSFLRRPSQLHPLFSTVSKQVGSQKY